MTQLVSQVRATLKGKTGVGPTLPYWMGMVLGYAADLVAKLSGRTLPVSSIRVKKFTSSTQFQSAKNSLDDFQPPFSLSHGIERTLTSEFISPSPSSEIFYTE